MLHCVTLLWDKNEHTHPLSGSYDESWVNKLYCGFKRNLTQPFKFVCFVDRKREFIDGVEQELLSTDKPNFGHCIEPYKLNEPMILVGLDTVIVGNIDHFAEYCLTGEKIAMMRDKKSYRLKNQGYPDQSINGVQFAPAGWKKIYDEWDGGNDMVHMRRYPWECIDDKWGMKDVVSYKFDVRSNGDVLRPGTKIVYFHGQPKMDSLTKLPWMQKHWRID